MTASERVRYQKLPGRRRGILRGSGVWLGPDHLLLVRSWRFREEYKRFHMGDIQAIAVAASPRFHISTRSIGIAVLWLIGFAFASSRGTWAQISIWAVAVALVSAWVYISASCSCVCRIYTAVSHDELPSIYRTWTARKFVSRVKPHIEAAQGVIEGDWADIVDARRIGPPEPAPDMAQTSAGNLLQDKEGGARRSAPLSEIFVAMMFVDALFSFATRHSMTTVLTRLGYAMLGIEIGLSIALLVQHNRGRLRAGMQKLVIASILVTGMTWYSPPFIAAMSAATAARTKSAPAPAGTAAGTVIQDIDIGAHLLWGLTGIAILLMPREIRARGTFAG